MTIQSDMALLAAGAYWDIRSDLTDPISGADQSNRAPLPPGWRVLTDYDTSNTGGWALFSSGFSARVYQNISTNEIVISFSGTEFGASPLKRPGFYNDFISGNIPLALGIYGEQAYQAALLYQRVKADPALSDNISFTGHSLGGGLASVMAVWFDRPAYVFAPAPFEKSAYSTQPTGVLAQYLSAGVMPTAGNRGRKSGSDSNSSDPIQSLNLSSSRVTWSHPPSHSHEASRNDACQTHRPDVTLQRLQTPARATAPMPGARPSGRPTACWWAGCAASALSTTCQELQIQ